MRLTIWSGLTEAGELTNGGIKMENFVGNVECSNLYTAIKDLSNTCKTVTKSSIFKATNNFAKTLTETLKTLPIAVEPSKSLVNHLPYYKAICSV